MLIDELGRLERLLAERWPEVVDAMPSPATDAQIAALRAAVEPMVLPADVEALYRWHDGGTQAIFTPWIPMDIERVVESRSWRLANLGEPPVLLCLFTDGGGDSLLVETSVSGDAIPGIVWQQPHADDPVVEYRSLEDLVRTTCELVEVDLVEHHELGGLVVSDWRAADDVRVRLNPGTYSFLRPDVHTMPRFPDPTWPESWLQSVGIDPKALAPRGATHTIAELIARAGSTSARGTVAGRVRIHAGSMATTWVTLSDETGSLSLSISADVAPFSPLPDTMAEIDVEVASDAQAAEYTQKRAADIGGDPIMERLMAGTSHRPAVALAFRRL